VVCQALSHLLCSDDPRLPRTRPWWCWVWCWWVQACYCKDLSSHPYELHAPPYSHWSMTTAAWSPAWASAASSPRDEWDWAWPSPCLELFCGPSCVYFVLSCPPIRVEPICCVMFFRTIKIHHHQCQSDSSTFLILQEAGRHRPSDTLTQSSRSEYHTL
jgi:hypothetical protein